jgi:hypothetical protein
LSAKWKILFSEQMGGIGGHSVGLKILLLASCTHILGVATARSLPSDPSPRSRAAFSDSRASAASSTTKASAARRSSAIALRLREGPGAIDAEHLAGLTSGIHTSLLSSHPESVTNDEPVKVFAEWPKDWDAAFTLLARGGFLMSTAQQNGAVPLVEIVSQNGGPLKLSNPWGAAAVTVYRNGRKSEDTSGDVLSLQTAKNETVVVVPKGRTPATVNMQ